MCQTVALLALLTAADPPPARWHESDRPAQAEPFLTDLRLSADGRRLVTGAYGAAGTLVRAVDLPSGKSVTLHDSKELGVYAPTPSPDGKWVVGVRGSEPDWRLVIWDAATGREVYADPKDGRPPAGYWRTRMLGFDRGGGAWVVRPTGIVDRVAVPSGRVTGSVKLPFTGGAWGRLILSPGGDRLAVGGGTVLAVRSTHATADWQVVERHPESTDREDLPQPTTCPIACGFSPDGRRLVTYDRKGEVVAVWAVGDKVTKSVSRPAGLTPWTHLDDLRFTPDGKRFVFRYAPKSQARAAQELRVWDAATLKEVERVAPAGGVDAFAVKPDGRLLVGHPDGTLSRTGQPTREPPRRGRPRPLY